MKKKLITYEPGPISDPGWAVIAIIVDTILTNNRNIQIDIPINLRLKLKKICIWIRYTAG